MSLFDTLRNLFKKDAVHYVYTPIDHNHVKNPKFADSAVTADTSYFRLWLAEMFLEKSVNWFQSFYPMAHSLVVFQFGHQRIEIPHVAGGAKLEGLTAADVGKVIGLNYPMTALMPFGGGVVELVTALVAMKGENYAAPAIKVLGNLSKMLIVPQLSAALNVALPIAAGIQDMVSGSGQQIHLGVHQSFTGDGGGAAQLRAGYIAVIRGKESDYPAAKLWVQDDQLRYGDSQEKSKPLEGVTYMLLRIEAREQRDDWTGLKDIGDAFAEALKYLGDGDEEKAKLAFNRAAMLVRMSPDLTRTDRNRVAKALKEEYLQAQTDGIGALPKDRSLDDVVARRAPKAADVDELGLQELLIS